MILMFQITEIFAMMAVGYTPWLHYFHQGQLSKFAWRKTYASWSEADSVF